jgi:pimeloyl-ACP methyl ester carboxylesterase
MKFISILVLIFSMSSCNLAKWNQDSLTKKFDRNDINEHVLEENGHSIHYFSGGNECGEVILLIHGFGGDAQVTWRKTILDLSKDYTVIAADLLWFGQSKSDQKKDIYSQINAIETLLNFLRIDSFSVAGISYGGFVAMGLAQVRENQVNKLIIVDSPGITYNTALLDSMVSQNGVNEVSDIFVPRTPEKVQALFDFVAHKDKKLPKRILQDVFDLYFSGNQEELKQLIVSLPDQKAEFLEKGFEQIPKSYLIWGEFDEVFPLVEGTKLADYLGAEIMIVPKAGHAPNIENYKSFEEFLRYCLDD